MPEKTTDPVVPSAELIDRARNLDLDNKISELAIDLNVARVLWRTHRKLVEAPRYPKALEIYLRTLRVYQHKAGAVRLLALTPEEEEQMEQEALEVAAVWMKAEYDVRKATLKELRAKADAGESDAAAASA